MNSLYIKPCLCLAAYGAVLAINSMALGRYTAVNILATVLSAIVFGAYYFILDAQCTATRSLATRKKRVAKLSRHYSFIFAAISGFDIVFTMAQLRMPYRLFPGPLPGIFLLGVSLLLIQTRLGRPKSACLKQVKL